MQIKIDRMVDYWRRSSHLANCDYIRRQMELASRLLQIVLKKGKIVWEFISKTKAGRKKD